MLCWCLCCALHSCSYEGFCVHCTGVCGALYIAVPYGGCCAGVCTVSCITVPYGGLCTRSAGVCAAVCIAVPCGGLCVRCAGVCAALCIAGPLWRPLHSLCWGLCHTLHSCPLWRPLHMLCWCLPRCASLSPFTGPCIKSFMSPSAPPHPAWRWHLGSLLSWHLSGAYSPATRIQPSP